MSNDTEKNRPPSVVAYAGLIAAFAGLISSWTAYQKARDERVARDSYVTTTKAIERLSDESQANHADIVALRKYLVDHVERQIIVTAPTASIPPPPSIEDRPPPVVVTKTASPGKGSRNHVPLSGGPLASATPKPDAPPAAPAPPAKAPAVMPDTWPE